MEVKPGYKQTDAGVISEEWDALQIRDVCRLINGRGFKPHEWENAGLPIIRIQNLNGSDDFNFYTGQFNPKILIEHGQLLFAWSGSRGTSFGPHIWKGRRALLNYHTWKVEVNESKVSQDFLFHALRQLTSYIEDRAHGASALVHTQKWEMEKFPILIPLSLREQLAIAEALNDVDMLLGALDRLIAKKRDLKQAATQQLLTGQTRLPGFSGTWEMKRMADACWFQEGPGVGNSQFTTSGIKLLNGTNIFRGKITLESTDRFISEKEAFGRYAHFLADAGDIVIACSGIAVEKFHEKVAVVEPAHLPFCMNTSTMRFKPHLDCFVPGYLRHFLMSDVFKRQIAPQATGSAQLNFGPTHVATVTLSGPELTEQNAIANVLTDMDQELVALGQRQEKTRALKQAMMQELLTGRVRLV